MIWLHEWHKETFEFFLAVPTEKIKEKEAASFSLALDFIGNKDCSFVYPQITQIFADFSFENSLICVIGEICGLFPIMSII